MTFLAPMMLWGGLAAGIPIALHFFFRSRYRTVPWAAMKFLLTSIEQTSRRLRFQELLLLMCRVLVLALLALALARPLSSVVRGAGGGDAVDAVFVFDTSMSMGARDGAATRLERAKTAALDILKHLPNHSTVQIVTCADRAEPLRTRSPSDFALARQLIEELEVTSLATNLAPGVSEAAAILERGQASNKELYLFSDMQKLGWQEQSGELVRTLRDLKDKTAIHLVRCGTRTPANVSIVGITPQIDMPRPGERVGFAVLVRNTGSQTVADLKVSLTVDDHEKSAETQSLAQIGPGETRSVPLTGKLDKAGPRLLTARVAHDDLDGDNRFDRVLFVREQVNVLVVDGGPPERDPRNTSSYFLVNALLPIKESEQARYVLQPKVIPPNLAAPGMLSKTDLVVLVNVALAPDVKTQAKVLPADFGEELARFVRQGKSLMIFGGDHIAPAAYNKVLGEKHGLLPLPIKGRLQAAPKEAFKINPQSVGLPEFWRFRDDKFFQSFKDVEAYQILELDETASATADSGDETDKKKADPPTVVFRYQNGTPAIVERTLGAGKVFLFTSAAELGFKSDSADPTWTNWPIHPTYAPFINVTLNYLLQGQTQSFNVVAGQPLDWYPTEKELRTYTLVHPNGQEERLGLPEKNEKKGNRPMVTATKLTRAGIYYMVAGVPNQESVSEVPEAKNQQRTPIAVVPEPRESEDLSSFSDEKLDDMLGFTPIHMTAGAGEASSTSDRLNREWTTWLLVLVLFLAFGESLLAYWCGRAW